MLGVTIAAFLLVHLIPGDPALAVAGENATPDEIARARAYLQLDRPLPEQYLTYLVRLLHGDLGVGMFGRPVVVEFAQRFPATVELTLVALLYGIFVGIPVGRWAAQHPGRWGDFVASSFSLAGLSTPLFVLGLLLQYVFAVRLGILPATGRIDPRLEITTRTGFLLIDTVLAGRPDAFADALRHLLLPAITLGSLPLAYISRLTRSSILEAGSEDYVRTARGKGLREARIINGHVMPNAWLPVLTMIGLQVGHLLGGAVITETVFAWDGVGSWVVASIENHDFVVVQSAVLIFAAIFLVVNLVVDIGYAILDPRIRLSATG